MGWLRYFNAFIAILLISLLFFYYFIPFNSTIYSPTIPSSSNFSLSQNVTSSDIQFYENMRYTSSTISYRIFDCPLSKKDEMYRAISFLENSTNLNFREVQFNEEITVTCDSTRRVEGGSFIAGEGGTTNVTKTSNFNVIHNGHVLLLRESQCEKPIVGTHELLHALGFDHSNNPSNIMYPSVDCRQTIGQDLISFINNLYSYPSLPDLSFEKVSATTKGKYLDASFTIRNNGLTPSKKSKVEIKSGDEIIKEIEIKPLDVGFGIEISFENNWVPKLDNDEELSFNVVYSDAEIDKTNNVVSLN